MGNQSKEKRVTNLSNSTVNRIKQVGSIYSAVTDKELNVEDVVELLLNDFLKRFNGLLPVQATKPVKEVTSKKVTPKKIELGIPKTPSGRISWNKHFDWSRIDNGESVTLVIGRDIPKGSSNNFKQAARKRGGALNKSVSIKNNGFRSITIQFSNR